jgi:hypothetical protein
MGQFQFAPFRASTRRPGRDDLHFFVSAVLLAGALTLLGVGVFGCSTGSSSGGSTTNTNHDPLRHTLQDPPYLEGADGVDVTTVVEQGVSPYSCHFYSGPGQGTVPAGVYQDPQDPSGCRLRGAVGDDEPPGGYGFIMVVEDAVGDSVEIPVHYRGPACATAAVTLTPAASPPQVKDGGIDYTWSIAVTDIDFPCDDASCATCHFCLSMQFLALDPLSGATDLLCQNEGDVCSDCEADCLPQTPHHCPGQGTMNRSLQVRPHDPIRQGAGWVTMEIEINYTGDDLAACGAKQWTCHFETLELNR